jgi:hypothetical protein
VYGDTSNSDKKINPAVLALFNKLTCRPGILSTTWKNQVGYTDSAQRDNLNAQIVSCNTTTGEKYLLDVAKVRGEDVSDATAALSSTSNQWQVNRPVGIPLPRPHRMRAGQGPGQRPRRSGSLAAISAATAAWLGLTYRCKVASRLWPLMAISSGALTFASPRWVSRECRSWCRVLPPE